MERDGANLICHAFRDVLIDTVTVRHGKAGHSKYDKVRPVRYGRGQSFYFNDSHGIQHGVIMCGKVLY